MSCVICIIFTIHGHGSAPEATFLGVDFSFKINKFTGVESLISNAMQIKNMPLTLNANRRKHSRPTSGKLFARL